VAVGHYSLSFLLLFSALSSFLVEYKTSFSMTLVNAVNNTSEIDPSLMTVSWLYQYGNIHRIISRLLLNNKCKTYMRNSTVNG
jgi:hypothetical protein